MKFVEFETFVGRKIMVNIDHVVAFQECRDVIDCGCKILTVNGDWLYLKEPYERVENKIFFDLS